MSAEWLTLVVAGLAALLMLATLPGTVELALVTLGALLAPLRSARPVRAGAGDGLVTVVPAHQEEDAIAACVASLRTAYAAAGSAPDGRILVVADNCDDDTAARATAAGARVLDRRDPTRRGKGYALELGFAAALADPRTGAVVVVDADTAVEPTFIAELAGELAAGADAVQARYEVGNPGASLATRLMRVELLAFNLVRPRGRARWGLSAGLLGNGFALSRATLAAVPWTAHSIVEDLEYHLRLVRNGRCVRFAARTGVRADVPAGGPGARTQRARWEGGRLRIMLGAAPGLAAEVLRGRRRLAEPLLELLLLPLAFHVLLLGVALGLPSPLARGYALAGLAVVAAHVLSGLLIGGGGWRDLAALAAAPLYVLWKAALTPAIARAARRDAVWTRTARAPEARR